MDDPDVERVRRAHLNDLENIVPFLLLCPLYLTTGPSVCLAATLIRGFAAGRILHTVGYLNEVSSGVWEECGGRVGSFEEGRGEGLREVRLRFGDCLVGFRDKLVFR